jgi:hypothetical protein
MAAATLMVAVTVTAAIGVATFYLLAAHEPYQSPHHPVPINTTIVHAQPRRYRSDSSFGGCTTRNAAVSSSKTSRQQLGYHRRSGIRMRIYVIRANWLIRRRGPQPPLAISCVQVAELGRVEIHVHVGSPRGMWLCRMSQGRIKGGARALYLP